MASQTLKVSGMTCEKCEKAVKDALYALDGVENVEVSLETGNVDVQHNSVRQEELERAIEDQGYDVEK